MKNCPTCLRAFEKMTDYPLVTIDKVEIPDNGILGVNSGWGEDPWGNVVDVEKVWREIADVEAFRDYLSSVALSGKEPIKPVDLLPPWEPDGYFTWAYKIESTWKHLGFRDEEKEDGICHIAVFETGPNLGSAGGPTLTIVGIVATLHYTPIIKNG